MQSTNKEEGSPFLFPFLASYTKSFQITEDKKIVSKCLLLCCKQKRCT